VKRKRPVTTPRPPRLPEPPALETAWAGIPPSLLLEQVASTAPFLFADDFVPAADEPHLALLRRVRERVASSRNWEKLLSLEDYFELCLAAHHATVATFVPTDVDVHIREKLWRRAEATDVRLAMAATVLRSRRWSSRRVSARSAGDDADRTSGHDGEWFSTAVAAYAALRSRAPTEAEPILAAIFDELAREAALFRRVLRAGDGIEVLRMATVLAHNAGDLDRVMDAWHLRDDDPLRTNAYRVGHEKKGVFAPFFVAGIVNKAMMAPENHRNFALRRPRCLRRRAEYLLPIGPFFDAWGLRLARQPTLDTRELGEVAEALVDGMQRLKGSVGYVRALAGLEAGMPGGAAALHQEMPAKLARWMKSGELRQQMNESEEKFLGRWNAKLWRLVAAENLEAALED
jgi:hypothetical protein